MGKSSKKFDIVSIAIIAVLAVALVMAIVGICITWTSATVGSKAVVKTLSEWAEINGKTNDGLEGFGVMQAFAYITLVFTILTAIVFVVSKFVNVKVLKWVVIAVAALTVISAIVLIATSYSFCGKDAVQFLCLSDKVAPAAGAWLLSIFGIVGGAAGVVGALKK